MITNNKSPRRRSYQREVILEILKQLNTHPLAVDVYNTVREKLPNISLGTVYRNLELLVEIGQIKRIKPAGEPSRFDATIADHHHIICTKCGRIEDIYPNTAFTDGIIREAESSTGFHVSTYSIDFIGLCPECKPNKSRHGEKGERYAAQRVKDRKKPADRVRR